MKSSSWRDWRPPAGSKSTLPSRAAEDARIARALLNAPTAKKFNKFGAEKTVARDGTTLDSGHEAKVYQDLRFREAAGEITDLQRQVTIPLVVNGVKVCIIKVDFVFLDKRTGARVYLEAKSPVTRTRQYVITRKLFLAIHGVAVEEA